MSVGEGQWGKDAEWLARAANGEGSGERGGGRVDRKDGGVEGETGRGAIGRSNGEEGNGEGETGKGTMRGVGKEVGMGR